MENKNSKTIRIPLPILPLTILFVILKAFGAITWSWVWVLSPLWLPFALFLCGFLFLCVLAVIGAGLGK